MNRLEPFDADEDLIRVVPARNVELFPLRRAAPDKHRIELAAVEERLQAVDRRVVPNLDPHVDDVGNFLVEDGFRKAERRDVDAHQPARPRQLLENRDLVAQRHEVVGDRERGRTSADEPDFLAVGRRGRSRKEMPDLVAVVRRNALQPADGDRFAIDARPAAGRLAGPVAGASENPGEDVGLTVEEIRLRESSLGDETDVLRDVRVRRARPLTVHHAVVVVGVTNVGRLHQRVIIRYPMKRLSADDLWA